MEYKVAGKGREGAIEGRKLSRSEGPEVGKDLVGWRQSFMWKVALGVMK